jgi:hypothetical protein
MIGRDSRLVVPSSNRKVNKTRTSSRVPICDTSIPLRNWWLVRVRWFFSWRSSLGVLFFFYFLYLIPNPFLDFSEALTQWFESCLNTLKNWEGKILKLKKLFFLIAYFYTSMDLTWLSEGSLHQIGAGSFGGFSLGTLVILIISELSKNLTKWTQKGELKHRRTRDLGMS